MIARLIGVAGEDMENPGPPALQWHFPPDYEARSMEILNTALDRVGLYSSWKALDPGPDRPADDRYGAMPALTKSDIRAQFPDVLPPDRDMAQGIASGEIALVETSGTTADKITNIWNQEWWDASERASWSLNSWMSNFATGSHREAILVNPKNVGIVSDMVDLPMEKRRLSRFLYLNEKTDPLSWSSRIMDRMVAELDYYRPVVLEANPSMLARLCRYISDHDKKVYQPGVIVFTYEYPTILHRRQISEVFDVPMCSSYGTTEVGYVFMECEAGKFHQNSEFCRVDFEPFEPRHGGPLLGRILVTPFRNPWSYFVRFNPGDLVCLDQTGRCPCGRDSGMLLSSIEGRAANLTVTLDGRLVTLGELDRRVGRLRGLEEYKLVQTDARRYRLRIVSGLADISRLGREAVRVLKDLYGPGAEVSVDFTAAIPPETSGKYMISTAMFPLDTERYLANRPGFARD